MKKKLFFIFLAGVLFAIPRSGLAQTGLSGFDLRLFRPPADGSGLLNLHGSETVVPRQLHFGLVTEYSHGLLAATQPLTGQSIRVVDDLVVSNLQAAVGITELLTAGLTLPVAFYEKGTNFNTAQGFQTTAIGDLSLDLKARFLEDEGWRPGMALVSQSIFPTGDPQKFTGSSTYAHEFKLAVDKQAGPFYLVANLGYQMTGRTQVANLDVDDRFTFGGGGAWTLPFGRRFTDLMAEIDGTHVLRSSNELTTPVEWLIGLRQRLPEGLSVELAGGRGITNGVGSGESRLIAAIRWSPSFARRSERPVFLDTIYFGFGKEKFLPKYEPQLKAVAQKSRKDHGLLKIRGHTDNEGSESFNEALSKRRADEVARHLIEKGLPARRLKTEAVGSKEPASDNRTAEGKSRNRRVEILLMQPLR